MKQTALVSLALIAICVRGLSGEAEKKPSEDAVQVLETLMEKLSSADPAVQSQPQKTLEAMVFHASRPGAENERAALAKALAAKLGTDVPVPARMWMLWSLERIGRSEAVPAVAGLLNDKDERLRDWALRAMQNNPSPEAGEALRSALANEAAPKNKLALIRALGYRKESANAPALLKETVSNDESVGAAALSALAASGDKSSIDAIAAAMEKGPEKVKQAATDAYLLLAEQLGEKGDKSAALAMYRKLLNGKGPIRCAAITGLGKFGGAEEIPAVFDALNDADAEVRGTASLALLHMPRKEVGALIAARLKDAPTSVKAALVAILAASGDKGALPILMAAASDTDSGVRIVALSGLGDCGDASAVPLLLKAAAATKGAEQDAARESLARLRGPEVGSELLVALLYKDAGLRSEAIRTLATQKDKSVAKEILKAAEDADAAVRAEALKALAVLAEPDAAPAVIGLLLKAKDDAERELAGKAAAGVCQKINDADKRADAVLAVLAGASGPARLALLNVLGQVGGKKALEAVRAALKTPAEEDAAVRALAGWPDDEALPDLLVLARSATKESHCVLALRGYVRLLRLPSDRKPKETLKLYKDGLEAAGRSDEKKLVLGGLGDLHDPGALELIAPYLEDAKVAEEACAATVKLCRHYAESRPGLARPPLEKVLAITKNPETKRRAQSALEKLPPGK